MMVNKILSFAIVLIFCSVYITATASNFKQALGNYVSQPESAYSYKLIGSRTITGATIYTLNVTSLTWLPISEVGAANQWFHYVEITIPTDLNKQNRESLFFISNGDNNLAVPGATDETASPIHVPSFMYSTAVSTKSVTAIVYMIPNQPISYNSDPTHASRVEDAIIAYGWNRFMTNTTNANLLYVTQLPQVKGSKMAMDAVTAFVKKQANHVIEKFTVSGASKRGWTTILLAAVDTRVAAIAPMVIPVYATKDFIVRTYNNLCAWPWAFYDYVTNGVTDNLFNDVFNSLTDIVDPLNYNRLNTIPKYQIFAMGDEFFAPDLNTLAYSKIKGDKYVRYIPNTGHLLLNSNVLPVLGSFYASRLSNNVIPKYVFSHEFVDGGIILHVSVTNNVRPTSVKLWTATNALTRDFRTSTIGTNVWQESSLVEVNELEWQAYVRNPTTGWTTAMIELTFANSVNGVAVEPLVFTTNSFITPDTIPCNISKKNLPTKNFI